MRALSHWRFAAVFITAAFLSLNALWIPAKAELAQWLLERSWNDIQAGAEWSPPWPWADTQPVAVLSVPSLNIRQLVLEGDSGRNLAFGPVLRGSTSSRDLVISAHRDTHFTFVRELEVGDQVSIEIAGEKRTYGVSFQEVIDTTHNALVIEPGIDRLSLVTCYPFDAIDTGGPLRYVVTALPLPGET
ncbi:MAG TPA: class GN sortase [Xanthomonadales bacterium]|nr:class GN sortase [Xanthomonadales bacterium]